MVVFSLGLTQDTVTVLIKKMRVTHIFGYGDFSFNGGPPTPS